MMWVVDDKIPYMIQSHKKEMVLPPRHWLRLLLRLLHFFVLNGSNSKKWFTTVSISIWAVSVELYHGGVSHTVCGGLFCKGPSSYLRILLLRPQEYGSNRISLFKLCVFIYTSFSSAPFRSHITKI